jgi:hypothetical protein
MPSLDPNLPHPFTRQSASALRELAEHYWRISEFEPQPSLNRMQAIFLHGEAIKLEAGVTDRRA